MIYRNYTWMENWTIFYGVGEGGSYGLSQEELWVDGSAVGPFF